ncbi:hypothetical protein DFQ05_0264 [Winogradskyella wandonensis]|uniref:Fibronectin type-III domain-containing protein n=1 Tax=Winogradskyella wandonensis TaxID=1442586 RepID=A0A4R1KUB1_9FLAO|nr:hypothetical protein [Winogradskyella wandonensis]TCK68754.1 hypothetical protein DFQ05_0264 [Winogradskyella wandonensis]
MKKIVYIFCVFLVLLSSCKDTTDDMIDTTIPFGEIQDEVEGVQLIFPLENELCTTGTNITDTESTVLFEWVPNNNADSYNVTVENLNTGEIIELETTDFLVPITIARANSFRWFVSYVYRDDILTSESWNFYNAGIGVQTYPPFPAEIISPTMAQNILATSTVTLQWNGNDVDDDIVGYDVYFGTSNPPEISNADITNTEQSVAVTPDTIYYWSITTKDAEGNESSSVVFQFKVLN